MTKSRLASFLDSCLISSSVVFIMLILLSKLKLGLIIKLLISAILGGIVFILYSKREKKRYKNQQLKYKDQYKFNLTMLKLQLMTTREKQSYFNELFKKLASHEPQNNQNITYTLCFGEVNQKSADNNLLQKVIDQTKNKKELNHFVILLTNDINTSILEKYKEIEKKNITLLFPEDLYSLIKKHDYFPDISTLEKTSKPIKENIKTIFSNLLQKKNAKSFFFSALLILFSSLFVPYKTYYKTISLILLLISTTCLIFGKNATKVYT